MGEEGAMNFQVVVLAGGLSKTMYPLVSKDVPKALLPVGNRPLLSYVLELVEASNIKDIIVVVSGDDAALCVGNWVTEAFHDRLHVKVCAKNIQVSHGLFSVDFLEQLASHGDRGLSYPYIYIYLYFGGFAPVLLCTSLRIDSQGARGLSYLIFI